MVIDYKTVTKHLSSGIKFSLIFSFDTESNDYVIKIGNFDIALMNDEDFQEMKQIIMKESELINN